jgi:hypothetical protein
MRGIAVAGALSLILCPGPAAAQSYGGASSSDLLGYRSSVGHYKSRSVGARVRSEAARRPVARQGTGGRARPAAPAVRTPLGSTAFRPVGPPLFPKQFAAEFPRNPVLESYFNSLLSAYKELLQRLSVAPNDVSRAASFLIASSYFVLNDGQELDEAQFVGLRTQMREIMGSDPEFQRLNDQEKQKLYEKYAIFGMHLRTAHSLYSRSGNRKELASTKAMAREQLEDVFGLPAGRLVFRTTGVHLR